MTKRLAPSLIRFVLILIAHNPFYTIARAQTFGPPRLPPEAQAAEPLVPIDLVSLEAKELPTSLENRAARLRLPGMISGFLYEPLEIATGDIGTEPFFAAGSEDDRTGFQVSWGTYNPLFDMRRPGDPAHAGFAKFHTQLQVMDLGTTSVCLGMQALLPAGPENGGIGTGQTIVSPAFSWFQDLGAGNALQGYLGKNIHTAAQWNEQIGFGFHYGIAFQCPVPGLAPSTEQGLFFFLQAMGQYRYDISRPDGGPPVILFYPGLHWRLNESCWLSVGASRWNLVTCSWQF